MLTQTKNEDDVAFQRRLRIRLSVWAYAYEFMSESLVSDSYFDAACSQIDLTINTENSKLDIWWKENFTPSTGMWIRRHPDLSRIEELAVDAVKKMRND